MSGGYAKVWTKVQHGKWFQTLTCNQRGVWLQLIILAKDRGRSGGIFYKSCSGLAHDLGIDRSTLGRTLRKFQQAMNIDLDWKKNGELSIHIRNFKFYQEIATPKNPDRPVEKSTKKKSYNKIRLDKTRLDKSRATPIERFEKWIPKNQHIISALAQDLKLSETVVEFEIGKMKAWVRGDPVKGNKKLWGKFVSNWLKREVQKLKEKKDSQLTGQAALDSVAKRVKAGEL